MDPLKAHKKKNGKIEIRSKASLKTRADLSLWYTPGVGKVASYLGDNPKKARDYTIKRNTVLVVSDGSAVLGLGNIGPYGALPVMEGKCMIFREFGNVDAFPLVLNTQDVDKIVRTVEVIAPAFGGINLEDIAAPRCFEVEEQLRAKLDIPVFHDDQHGTAIVVMAGLLNALKVVKKKLEDIKIVVSGAGAAGTALAKLLVFAGAKNVIMLDSKGIISKSRPDLHPYKKELAKITNPANLEGVLIEAMLDADVFVGVSKGNILTETLVKTMAPKPIIFALANPVPEIHPKDARRAGAAVIATGRSDFPNQINNSLVFPGIFRGALDHNVREITMEMKLKAAKNLAALVKNLKPDSIIPSMFDKRAVKAVAKAVK